MSEKHTAEAVLEMTAAHREMLSHRFFFGYLYDRIIHTSLYLHWKQLLSWLRRFRTVAFVLRTITIIFAILETGALVVLSTAVFLVILPLSVAFMLGILITAAIESLRSNRVMQKALQKRHVCVLFMPHESGDFFAAHAKALATEGYAVLIVSPYLILSKGLSDTPRNRGFYCTLRRECENVYLIRRYYLFSLRRHVLKGCNVAYVY
jgi:hypothetical protein